MSVRSETLGEVIDWLGDEADREWERAKDGLSDGYGGFDAYTRAIEHCQEVDENVPRPASFVTQVGREFGVRNLSCPAKVMTASELRDMGSYHCVYTYGANDANLRNVTLVVADGNKVGLYDADGKALK